MRPRGTLCPGSALASKAHRRPPYARGEAVYRLAASVTRVTPTLPTGSGFTPDGIGFW